MTRNEYKLDFGKTHKGEETSVGHGRMLLVRCDAGAAINAAW